MRQTSATIIASRGKKTHITWGLSLFFMLVLSNAFATPYYVNDGTYSGERWCTAVGNDANNGTDPSTPKLTLLSVLTTYDLGAGDIVYIDNGSYS